MNGRRQIALGLGGAVITAAGVGTALAVTSSDPGSYVARFPRHQLMLGGADWR